MCFKKIYNQVEKLKNYNVQELLQTLDISVIYYECLEAKGMYINTEKPLIVLHNDLSDVEHDIVMIHEIGHYLFNRNTMLLNQRTEENNANVFMCLYLIKNDIWKDRYFDRHLIDMGVSPKVARMFNDRVWQFKTQLKYEIVY